MDGTRIYSRAGNIRRLYLLLSLPIDLRTASISPNLTVCTSSSIGTTSIACGFHVRRPLFWLIVDAVMNLLKPLPHEIPGGEIVRDPGLGVLCDTAATLVENISPNKSEEETAAMLKMAMKNLNSLGLVGVHEAGVIPRNIKLYRKYSSFEVISS